MGKSTKAKQAPAKASTPASTSPAAPAATEALVKLQLRVNGDWTLMGDNGEVYRAVDGVLEVPAGLAARLEGDPDYTVIG